MSGTRNTLLSAILDTSSRPVRPEAQYLSIHLHEPLHGLGQLRYLLVGLGAVGDGLPDAVLHVVPEDEGGHLLGGGDVGADLGEDVHAVGLFLYHALHPANLALDAPEPVPQLLLVPLLDVPVRLLRLLAHRVASAVNGLSYSS